MGGGVEDRGCRAVVAVDAALEVRACCRAILLSQQDIRRLTALQDFDTAMSHKERARLSALPAALEAVNGLANSKGTLSMRALAGWCVRHRRLVVTGWLVALIGLTVISQSVGSSYKDSFSLNGTQSFEALQPAAEGGAEGIGRPRADRRRGQAGQADRPGRAQPGRGDAHEGCSTRRMSRRSHRPTGRRERRRSRARARSRSRT